MAKNKKTEGREGSVEHPEGQADREELKDRGGLSAVTGAGKEGQQVQEVVVSELGRPDEPDRAEEPSVERRGLPIPPTEAKGRVAAIDARIVEYSQGRSIVPPVSVSQEHQDWLQALKDHVSHAGHAAASDENAEAIYLSVELHPTAPSIAWWRYQCTTSRA